MANPLVRYGPQPPDRNHTEDLERDRRRNDRRLKGTFEQIFDKYTKDFSGIGDEIDLETGRIVVNNGHLARMQHERDAGASASRQYLQAAAGGTVAHNSTGRESDVDESDTDELSTEHTRTKGTPARYERESEEDDGNAADDDDDSSDSDSRAPAGSQFSTSAIDRTAADGQAAALTTRILGGVPAIQNSLGSLANNQVTPSFTIDPTAIQALGQNIANQISQFLTQHVHSVVQAETTNPWIAPPLPTDFANSRRPRTLTPAPSSTPARVCSPNASQSLWALPTAVESGRPRKRRRVHQEPRGNFVDSIRTSVSHGARDAAQSTGHEDHSSHQNISRLLAPEVQRLHAEHTEGETDYSSDAHTQREQETPLVDQSDYEPLRRGAYAGRRFTREEDRQIIELRGLGMKWSHIAKKMVSRSGNSISKRYRSILIPDYLVNDPRHQPVAPSRYIKREVVEIMDDEDEHEVVFARSTIGTSSPAPDPQIPSPHIPSPRPSHDEDEHDWQPAFVPMQNADHVQYSVPSYNERCHSPNHPSPPAWLPPPELVPQYPEPPLSRHSTPGQSPYYDSPVVRTGAGETHHAASIDHAEVEEPISYVSASGRVSAQPQSPRDMLQTATNDPPPQPKRRPGRPRKIPDPNIIVPPKQAKPRYTTFDTTQGTGRFGLLKLDQPLQNRELEKFAAEPRQQEILGPITGRTGTYGVLRVNAGPKKTQRLTGERRKRGRPPGSKGRTGDQLIGLRKEQKTAETAVDRETPAGIARKESREASTLFVQDDTDSATPAPALEPADAPMHLTPSQTAQPHARADMLGTFVDEMSTTSLPADIRDDLDELPEQFLSARGIITTPAPDRIVPNSQSSPLPTLSHTRLAQEPARKPLVAMDTNRSSPKKAPSLRSSVTRRSFRSPVPRNSAATAASSARSVRTRAISLDDASGDELA